MNLRFRFAFISALIGSTIAGVVMSVTGVRAASVGIRGIPALLSVVPSNWAPFMIGMFIVIVLPFLLTLVLGKLQKKRA
ncbi:UNVERIFIED_ORG: phosphotransferase system glucose/maltose/N-acetylglucosamine-specific IIC component [Bacillus sp. 1751]|nr:phosphotransferase system glucose/maltose/N-acetylglucosamine-specific IIC component [Bacillus sp. 1751]